MQQKKDEHVNSFGQKRIFFGKADRIKNIIFDKRK